MSAEALTTRARPAQRKPTAAPSARIWFITAADTPIGIAVARQAVERGDIVVAGASCVKVGYEEHPRRDEFEEFVGSLRSNAQTKGLITVVGINARLKEDCQAAIAEAIKQHGRIDILFICNSEALIGTLSELTATPSTRSTIPSIFTSNLFAPVNLILATLPHFRSRYASPHPPHLYPASTFPRPTSPTSSSAAATPTSARFGHGHGHGHNSATSTSTTNQTPPTAPHIILLSTIASHLGTPSLSAYSASQRAIEGYCDSLAYEVAPFGVRVSVVQTAVEVGVLGGAGGGVVPVLGSSFGGASGLGRASVKREGGGAGRVGGSRRRESKGVKKENDEEEEENCGDVVAQAQTTENEPDDAANAFARGTFSRIYAHLSPSHTTPSPFTSPQTTYSPLPPIPTPTLTPLLHETTHAILSIAGHANPPARHIVGVESVGLVKENLRRMGEELEEFLGVSGGVDF